jgi:predicted DNA-binding transcriptional regulator AlpA
MVKLSTEQVAKKLGISKSALSHYILTGKVAAPTETMAGGIRLRLWSESEIRRLRQALPKIANGRKTRYQKKQLAISSQQSAKAKKRKPKK